MQNVLQMMSQETQYQNDLISPPWNDSFWENLCFAGISFLFFFLRVIAELRWPIGAKFQDS